MNLTIAYSHLLNTPRVYLGKRTWETYVNRLKTLILSRFSIFLIECEVRTKIPIKAHICVQKNNN